MPLRRHPSRRRCAQPPAWRGRATPRCGSSSPPYARRPSTRDVPPHTQTCESHCGTQCTTHPCVLRRKAGLRLPLARSLCVLRHQTQRVSIRPPRVAPVAREHTPPCRPRGAPGEPQQLCCARRPPVALPAACLPLTAPPPSPRLVLRQPRPRWTSSESGCLLGRTLHPLWPPRRGPPRTATQWRHRR